MSWAQSSPYSRSPPSESRPHSRFPQPSTSNYYSNDPHANADRLPVATSLDRQESGIATTTTGMRRRGTMTDDTQPESRDKDPATKQVDQIVQHFFSKTVAVISQTRLTQQPSNSNPDFQDLPQATTTSSGTPSSSAMVGGGGGAPSLRRASSAAGASSSGKRKVGEKTNSWFNLTLPENEHFRTELKTWRNISTLLLSSPSSSSSFLSSPPRQPLIPSLVISVYLDASDLTSNQVLVLSDQRGRRTRVDRNLASKTSTRDRDLPVSSIPRSRARGGRGGGGTSTPGGGGGGGGGGVAHHSPTSIILERWTLSFQPPAPPPSHPSNPHSGSSTTSSSASTSSDFDQTQTRKNSISDDNNKNNSKVSSSSLPSVYKHSILHFRSLYTLVKVLPTYSIARKLNNKSRSPTFTGGNGKGQTNHGGLRIGIRVEVRGDGDEGEEEREGEVEVDVPIDNAGGGNGEDGKGDTTETVRFPGVETPLGTLHLKGTYRLNAEFGVEDIETLLSSRFIDEDFFRPTVNTARYRDKEDSGRPGSLPISARAGPAVAQSRLGTSPSHPSPPITGLGPLPSYGSLSSRHQYAPHPTSTAHEPVPPLPPPVPVPSDTNKISSAATESRPSLEGSPSVGSSSRLSTYGTSVPSRGTGVVEPAFISLSRARSGTNVTSGIQRASPSTSAGGTSGIIRRASLSGGGGGGGHSSSPSSGSPIFRPGSYLSSPSTGGGIPGGGAGGPFPGSSSPSFGAPPSRQQSNYFQQPSNSTSQLTFGNRISPLSPPTIPSGPSNLGATAPSRPIPLPASGSSPAAGGVPIRGYSYTSTGGAGSGSWSRSYGRGSSGSGGGGESYGGIEPPHMSRRTSSRLSFGANTGTTGGGSSSIPRSTGSREEEKRFVNEGRTPQDAGDINDFLKLLDEKPDLGGVMGGGSRLLGGSGIQGSTVLRKKDVDEQLKALRGSVIGFGMGGGSAGGASSPSPPMPAFAIQTASGTASPRGGFGGISNLRRQTSRLSIEEEPAEYATVTTTSRERRSPSEGEESSDNGLTPRQPFRQLRPDIVSPPLSATSGTSTVRHHHQQQLPLRSDSPMRIGLEPRLYPLPNSSATSPLASPATLPPFSSVYPPLPYPPSKARASTSTSTRTEPITFSPYISRAARLAQQERESGGGGGSSERNSAAASVSSFSSAQGDEVEAGSYRGEEEAVGRLELDDDCDGGGQGEEVDDSGRGRKYLSREVDEEEISLSHSRDQTPAAAIRLGSGGTASAGVSPYRRTPTAAGYFATRSHSRGGVGRTTRGSPPDSYLA